MPPVDDIETPVEAPDDIRSALMAAMDGAEPASEAVEAPAEVEKPTRARGPDGKFAPKDDADPAAVASEAPKPDEQAPAEVKPAATEPPANWSEADKAKFKTLPADGQEFLLRRHSAMEADYTKKTTEIAAFRRDYEPVAQIFAPHADKMRQSGFTPATLVKAWADVETNLMGGRGVDVVKSIVEQYKIDRQQIAQALGLTAPAPAAGIETPAAPAGTTAQLPPEIAAKLQGYDQFIAQQQQERQQAAAQQQREAENRVMSAIDQFRGEKDAAGALLHPHFEEVEDHMTRLIIAARTSGKPASTTDLNDLYDQAVWANPSTRAKALEATRAAEQAQHVASEAERAKEARAKAERARRAGSSVTGSPGTGQSAAPSTRGGTDSIRAALLAAAEEHEAA